MALKPEYWVVLPCDELSSKMITWKIQEIAKENKCSVSVTRELTGEVWGCIPNERDLDVEPIRLVIDESYFTKITYYS